MAALRHDRWRENLYGRTEEAQHLRGFWRTGLHHPGCQDCRVDRHLRWLRPVVTWHRFSWSQAVFSVSRPCRPDHPAQACSLGALAPGLQHRSQAQEIRPSNRSSIEVVRLAGYAHLKPELDRLWTRLSRPFCSRLQLHSFARDWLCKGTHGSVHALHQVENPRRDGFGHAAFDGAGGGPGAAGLLLGLGSEIGQSVLCAMLRTDCYSRGLA